MTNSNPKTLNSPTNNPKSSFLIDLFGTDRPVIGVIHLLPLPGSPRWGGNMDTVLERAQQEALALSSGGVHGIIVENFFDAPFTKNNLDPVTAIALSHCVKKVSNICSLPIGVNALRNDGMNAMAIAATSGAKFIRVNVYTGAMLTDQGLIEGQAHEILMYRRALMAENSVKIFADVMVKHAEPLSANSNIVHMAKDTVERGLADAIVISGAATGHEPNLEDLATVRTALTNTPIFIGSGSSTENIKTLLNYADGSIVASSLKRQGKLENPVDIDRVRSFVNAANQNA
jgi:membrane complex biogenesis BtpA family protein